jgi:NADPH:quinone reductase-like Zn-dependent oxidoreductase
MRAVRLSKFGVENIRVQEVADPHPASGEVLIGAEAATINPADQGMVSGAMASFLPASVTPP